MRERPEATGDPAADQNARREAQRPTPLRLAAALATVSLVLALSACGSAQEGKVTAIRQPSAASIETTAMFGAFTYGGVWRGMEPVLELELDIGRRLDIVHWFTNWDNPYFPEMVALASQGGRKPMISWQSHTQSVQDIAAGVYDDYVREWARGAATAPGLLYVRPFPEMNGYWTGWNGDPAALVAAWRRIVRIFDEEGATNVRWVFSPNVTDSPRTPENAMELYYPGADYVDVLALDGYNWGDVNPEIGWRSFERIFRAGYDRITALGEQPVWIAELASSGKGGDKSAWVREMFATTGFERIEALVWFNEDKEADWRIDSDVATLRAFREVLGSGATLAAVR